MAAMLTALVRPSMRSAPLYAIDAPTAGTGKSLLAEAIGLLATGVTPAALSQGKNPEEDEKRLSTVLMAGDPVIHIDNCEQPLGGDFLCTMLTQEVVQARILGFSERRVMPSIALVLATGNNLSYESDLIRRLLPCRLDARVERPDTRDFDFDCHAEIRAARHELVVAGLTILRAYVVADRPGNGTLKPMGSFSDFDWIRGVLMWLGMEDPAKAREPIFDSDPRRDELLSVMETWDSVFGLLPVEVKDIPNHCDLHILLSQVACRGVWSPKSAGWWLRRNKDRTVGNFMFREDRTTSRVRWQLVRTDQLPETKQTASDGRPAFLDQFEEKLP